MHDLIENHQLILMEAAIVERLRRSNESAFHPELAHAPFIYSSVGRGALCKLYQEYIDIASEFALPLMLTTPTWKANKDHVSRASAEMHSINYDAVKFLRSLQESQRDGGPDIKIGGLIGCKYDCYLPDLGLTAKKSQAFHGWQIEQQVSGGVDFLVAATLPSVQEALGIARAMEGFGAPYFISFVISSDGLILDGTPLDKAIEMIDAQTVNPPLAYMVNCAYPGFLHPENYAADFFKRFLGYQANASSLDHCSLEGANEIKMDPLDDWGERMLQLNEQYGVKLLGGCCGTNGDHLRYIAQRHAI